jgi:hypothetical protein
MARKRRGTRAGQKRKTRRAPGAALARAYGETRLQAAEKRAKRASSRARALRKEHTNPKAPQALGMGATGGAVVVAGGGAIAGVVGSAMPDVFGIDTRLLAGVALTFWGGSSKGKAAQIGACLGSGMLACVAQDLTAGLAAGEGLDLSVIGFDEAAEAV